MEWSIYHIREVNNIVICEFKSHKKTIWAYREKKILNDWVEFLNEINFNEKAEKVDIIDLPPSKQVIIRNNDKSELYFIFKSTTNKLMYELSDFYRIGTQPGPWEEKYKKLYLVYEELELNPDLVLKSIRHSLSHSRNYLNNKRTVDTLNQIFGDKKINLKNRKHFILFKEEYKRLKDITSELFIKRIREHITPDKKFEIYYIS